VAETLKSDRKPITSNKRHNSINVLNPINHIMLKRDDWVQKGADTIRSEFAVISQRNQCENSI